MEESEVFERERRSEKDNPMTGFAKLVLQEK